MKKFKISNKTYNIIRGVVLAAAGVVIVCASYSLMNSYLDYKEDEAKYAAINDMFLQTDAAEESGSGESSTSGEDDYVDSDTSADDLTYSSDTSTWVWDYEAMLEYNDEAKGYIKLDGTRIQYPIVEHEDNEYYLKTGSDKISNGAGAIFIDYRTAGLDGSLCIIYGHNMLDGSMFAALMDFRDSDFCKNHRTFDIYVGYRHYIYYVFSTFSAKSDDDDIYQFGFESDSDFQSWITKVAGKTTYDFGNGIPDTDDKIIMLSTCIDDYENRQLLCMYRGEEVVD